MHLKEVACSIIMCGGADMTCCFIGHRKIKKSEVLAEQLRTIIDGLIRQGVTNFIFGDHSEFDSLCYDVVSELKEEYPQIRRTHYRTDYPDADNYTMQFLLGGYEDSVCPERVASAGRAAYVERNQAMIHDSDICVFYFDEMYQPSRRRQSKTSLSDYQPKSGTGLAFDYAKTHRKKVINLYPKRAD